MKWKVTYTVREFPWRIVHTRYGRRVHFPFTDETPGAVDDETLGRMIAVNVR